MTDIEPTVTLPVSFLAMMHYEDCRPYPKGGGFWWFSPDYDGTVDDYCVPVRPLEPDEVEAYNLLADAIDALVNEPWHGHHSEST